MRRGNPKAVKGQPLPHTIPHLFKPGNKAAVGHGPWKKTKRWADIYHELFSLVRDDPDKLEKLIGFPVPKEISRRDAQLLLAARELMRALSRDGDPTTAENIRRWMDGTPTQRLDVNVQSKSFVELVKSRHQGQDKKSGGSEDE